jgi:CheY-like chemotaxis protein
MKILIADDDRVLTHLVSGRLRGRGWTVEVAHDALQALMFAMRWQPEAIVLDIGMPGGTGFGALEKLKKSTRTEDIPVVVMTSSAAPEDEARAAALGAVAYLRKPVAMEDLHATLTRVATHVA